jgi:hypothetical protein
MLHRTTRHRLVLLPCGLESNRRLTAHYKPRNQQPVRLLGPINTPPPTTQASLLSSIPSFCNHPTTSQHQLYSRGRDRPHRRELLPFAIVPLLVTKTGPIGRQKVDQASYRDGDVHGRQEQPEVGKPGIQGPEPVGAGPAGEPGQGAEDQVLHHAPVCHHVGVLEGLAPSSPFLVLEIVIVRSWQVTWTVVGHAPSRSVAILRLIIVFKLLVKNKSSFHLHYLCSRFQCN